MKFTKAYFKQLKEDTIIDIREQTPLTWTFRIFMFIVAVLWLVPLFWMIRTAFLPQEAAADFTRFYRPTLDNFIHVIQSAPFHKYYFNTIVISAVTLIVQIFLITIAAYAFVRLKFKGKNLIFILFLTQLMITPDVLIFPTYQLMTKLKLVNTLFGIMVPFFASAMGIFIVRQNLKTLPYELEEAAKMEGCSTWTIIWRIYAPLLKPTYAAFALISVSYHWNDFLWPLVMVNDIKSRPLTLGLAIFAQAFETGAQWQDICAATCLVVAPLLLIFCIFQKQFIESFANSGIK